MGKGLVHGISSKLPIAVILLSMSERMAMRLGFDGDPTRFSEVKGIRVPESRGTNQCRPRGLDAADQIMHRPTCLVIFDRI
jgi:hypothetical protein